ncbi:hypothetical protein [Spirochaeta dissipatitropha]
MLLQTSYAVPDTELLPSAERIFSIHEQMSSNESSHYRVFRFLDMLFPLSYTLFFYLSLRELTGLNRSLPTGEKSASRIQGWLPLIPLGAMAGDYAENILFLTAFNSHPANSRAAQFAAWPNGIKWLFLLITVVVTVYLLTQRVKSVRHRS